jgi:hypothetical protein
LVRNNLSNDTFPLLFFHFSGFDPFNPKLINRRHPNYNTDTYPSYIPLFEEYINGIYKNGYGRYSKMEYSFNSFQDGENILPLYRRLYRVYEDKFIETNPFSSKDFFYNTLKKNNLLTGVKSNSFSIFSVEDKNKRGVIEKVFIFVFSILKFIIGIRYYFSLISFLNNFTRLENQSFLIKKENK